MLSFSLVTALKLGSNLPIAVAACKVLGEDMHLLISVKRTWAAAVELVA